MKKLDPKAVPYFFISRFALFSIYAVAVYIMLGPLWYSPEPQLVDLYNNTRHNAGLILAVLLILGFIFSLVIAYLNYYFYRYEINDKEFKKEHGIIFKRYVTIPISRIQNIDIQRPLLARLFGLSDLQIQTAGYSASRYNTEGRLPALDKAVAKELQAEIATKIEQIASRSHTGLY